MASSNARAEVGPRGGRAASCSVHARTSGIRSVRADHEHQQSTPDDARAATANSRDKESRATCWHTRRDRIACRSPGGPVGPGLRALPRGPGVAFRATHPTRPRSSPDRARPEASPHVWTSLWTIGESAMGTPAADDLWAKVAAAVRAQLSEATWNTWFQGVHALDCTDDTLMLGVPSSVAVERIRTSYLGLLADAVQALTGVPHAIELIGRHRAPRRRRRGPRAAGRRARRRRRRTRPHRPSPTRRTPGPAPS